MQYNSPERSKRFSIIALLLLFLMPARAHTTPGGDVDRCFTSFPQQRPADAPRRYRLEYTLFNRDVAGTTNSRVRTTGEYTRGLDGGTVRWDNVRVASVAGTAERFSPGSPVPSMDGFVYRISQDIVRESFFARFPQGDIRHLIKTLVWDGAMLEMFDLLRDELQTLEPGVPRTTGDFDDFDVRMGDFATLKMKNLIVEWTGVSMMNGEKCALVYYRSWSNPVTGTGISGRSLYFGRLWVSMLDGEFECLTLNEDIVMDLPLNGAGRKVIDLQREVRFIKLPTPRADE